MEQTSSRRALVVDDDEALRRAFVRVLTKNGYTVEAAATGETAEEALQRATFDVILSDIDMPGMSGIDLLSRVRNYDLDVPVVLVTGRPSLETATKAIEYGALRYLVKPVELTTLVQVADDAVRLHSIAKAKRQALDLSGDRNRFAGDLAGVEAAFERAFSSLHIAYQPIVSWSGKSVFAYEALLRTREPSMPHPGAVFDAAERLGKVLDLSRRIREKAIEPIGQLDENTLLFINLHPSDLVDERLLDSATLLSRVAPRVVLEITERASLQGLKDLPQRVAALKELGFRIAIDDLGAGFAGLSSFALLEPNVVKLDMALCRNVHLDPAKQKIVQTIASMCNELDIAVVAEGIETPEERDALEHAGCNLMQGYLFARPGDGFPTPRF